MVGIIIIIIIIIIGILRKLSPNKFKGLLLNLPSIPSVEQRELHDISCMTDI